MFDNQRVLPAVNNMKDFERLLDSPGRCIIVLDSHISQIGSMVQMAKKRKKHLFLHADLIQGLKNDVYAAEYICQNIRPRGIISTRSTMLEVAKRRGFITVQRIFLLDSRSVETGYRLMQQLHPDMIEVLPGLIPEMIKQIRNKFGVPVIAGGLIRTENDVRHALGAGASAISTTDKTLWTFSG